LKESALSLLERELSITLLTFIAFSIASELTYILWRMVDRKNQKSKVNIHKSTIENKNSKIKI